MKGSDDGVGVYAGISADGMVMIVSAGLEMNGNVSA